MIVGNSAGQSKNYLGMGQVAGISMPNYNDDYIYSNKKSGTSDAEYRKQIVQQAYTDYANGRFQNKSDGFVKLMKRYTQEVSPDRRGIISSGLRAVSKNKQGGSEPMNSIEILLGGKVKRRKSVDSEYIEFYDKNGEMVATYSNMGWKMYTTKAEAARQTKMCMIYNAAWRDAKNGVSKVSVDGEESGFDCKA